MSAAAAKYPTASRAIESASTPAEDMATDRYSAGARPMPARMRLALEASDATDATRIPAAAAEVPRPNSLIANTSA